MKAELVATMKEEKIFMRLRFSGKGWDDATIMEKEKEKYVEAENLGMKWNHSQYEIFVDATQEACAPLVQFAEKNDIEIIQM